jgi:hypothetical protein
LVTTHVWIIAKLNKSFVVEIASQEVTMRKKKLCFKFVVDQVKEELNDAFATKPTFATIIN